MDVDRHRPATIAGVIVRNWWMVALRGVAAVVFGVLVLLAPAAGLWALVMLFGAWALVDGVFTVGSVLARRREEPHWFGTLVGGFLGIAIGVIAFLMPGVTAMTLVFLIAAWAVVTGVAEIVTAVRLRRVIEGEWLLILAGALSVAFGVLIGLFPGPGALALVLWIAVWAIVTGVALVALAFRLRSWGRDHDLLTG